MDRNTAQNELLRRVVADKELTREELARLPIEQKLELIALMQRRSNAIRRATGRPARPEWPLSVAGRPVADPQKR